MSKIDLKCENFRKILVLFFCVIIVIFVNVSNVFGITENDFEKVNKVKKLEEVKKEFNNIFKYTKVLDVKESEIAGLYEVYIFNKRGNLPVIIYYYPEKKLLFLGEIWDTVGNSITGQKKEMFYRNFYGGNLGKSDENSLNKDNEDNLDEVNEDEFDIFEL